MCVFGLPYAGSGAAAWRSWLDFLPDTVELFPIQLPGRETRVKEAPYRDVLPLVQDLAPALTPFLDRPFVFIGHSMGALISFELARELRRQNAVAPRCIFASGRVAPHLALCRRPFHNRTDPDLIDGLREMGATATEILENAELMKLLIGILRADFAVNESYRYVPQAPLDCPISAFAGLQDPEVNREQLEAWRIHTTGPFEAHSFPGGHFFLQENDLMMRRVSRELDRIANGQPGQAIST